MAEEKIGNKEREDELGGNMWKEENGEKERDMCAAPPVVSAILHRRLLTTDNCCQLSVVGDAKCAKCHVRGRHCFSSFSSRGVWSVASRFAAVWGSMCVRVVRTYEHIEAWLIYVTVHARLNTVDVQRTNTCPQSSQVGERGCHRGLSCTSVVAWYLCERLWEAKHRCSLRSHY